MPVPAPYRMHPLHNMAWNVPRSVVMDKPTLHAYIDAHERLRSLREETPITASSTAMWLPAVSPQTATSNNEIRALWRDAGSLRWRHPHQMKPVKVKPSNKLLKRFAGLAEEPPAEYKRFAEVYGPLGVDSMGDPNRYGRDAEAFAWMHDSKVKSESVEPHVESIDDWRRWARLSCAMLRIAGELQKGTPVPVSDWRVFDGRYGEPVEAWVPTELDHGASDDDSLDARRRKLLVNEQRETLASIVDDWLRLADVRVRCFWTSRQRGLDIAGPGGLFAGLAFQMADMIGQGKVPYYCFNCNAEITGRTKKPQQGRKSYCDLEACQDSRKRHSRSR